jgi:23S rRNA (pseudouridine1915-N3)-methyltransferase
VKLCIVAVGQKMPAWAQAACDEYARRFGRDVTLEIRTVKAAPRSAGASAASLMSAEAQRLEAAAPGAALRVVLDEHGQRATTAQLAERLRSWMREGRDVALFIGGPDGLAPALKARADETLRLSDLTLPHALARVMLVEALYRAWTLTTGHPYHRE